MPVFKIEAVFEIEARNGEEALATFDLGMEYLDWCGPGVEVKVTETRDAMRKRLGITKRDCEND